jgi:hypothetical protein
MGPVLLLSLLSVPQPARAGLDPLWYDGKAELAGYELVQPRYGELRKGKAILVFVSETFSDSMRVKADPGRHPASDEFPVLKLNVVKDFQTGIYDYNLMTSVFASARAKDGHRPGAAAKITFSGQEWCGHVFEELLFFGDRIDRKRFSYFDGEGDSAETLPRSRDLITVDELPILVRSIPAPFLAEGERKSVDVLPSLERTRLLHRSLAPIAGTLERSTKTKRASVPAGAIEVEEWTLELGGERYVYAVERAPPRRLVEWRGPEGERGQLIASDRLPYWELHRNGDERMLSRILEPAGGNGAR